MRSMATSVKLSGQILPYLKPPSFGRVKKFLYKFKALLHGTPI